MRTVIAIVALASSAVSAQAAEDRYGPPPAPRVLAAVGVAGQAQAARSLAPTPYAGRMLGWSGKVAPRALEQAPQPQPQPVPQYQPQPVAARAPVPFQPQAPEAAPRRQAALPQSLYDRPMAAPAPAPQSAPQHRPQPRPRQAAPAPATRAGDSGGARSYSVIREYGGQPDRIALPPPTSYWATREQAQPALADPTYGAGLSKKSGEAEPAGGVGEDPAAAPRPERKREART